MDNIDTIIKAFNSKPTDNEIEQAKRDMSKYFNTKGDSYLQYDADLETWLLRIKSTHNV